MDPFHKTVMTHRKSSVFHICIFLCMYIYNTIICIILHLYQITKKNVFTLMWV